MYRHLRFLFISFLFSSFACADASSLGPAGVAGGLDSGQTSMDGASDLDDAGLADAQADGSDAGQLGCVLGDLIRLSSTDHAFALHALSASAGRAAVAYSLDGGQAPRLQITELETKSVQLDQEIPCLDSSSPPMGMDYADGLIALAGRTADPSAPSSRLCLLDEDGTQTGSVLESNRAAVAIARESSGARLLSFEEADAGSSGDAGSSMVITRYTADAGQLEMSIQLGAALRSESDWDMRWRASSDNGVACGLTRDNEGAWLTLFEQDGSGSTALAAAERLTSAADFGCRVAPGPDFTAVAFAESEGAKVQLVWLGSGGSKLAGPIPILASYHPRETYDVAVQGSLTALAFFDASAGPPHVVVRVYPGPGEAPVQLNAEDGLGLGNFGLSGSVRLVHAGEGFLVGFASTSPLSNDVIVQTLLCR